MTRRLSFPFRIPFVEQLGFELWRFQDGESELRLVLGASHTNSWNVAHGGVLMTLLDVAMAHAARSEGAGEILQAPLQAPLQGPGLATIEMKTSFMHPAEGDLRAFGKLLQRTRTLAFCEGRVVDAQDRLCAHATGTFRMLRALQTSSGRTAQATSKPTSP